jgi:hypothetical protein
MGSWIHDWNKEGGHMNEPRDFLELELRPLPTSVADDEAISDDALLGQALHDLYAPGDTAELSPRTWAALAPVAREESSRRRRKDLAGKLAVALGPSRIMAYAAAILVLFGASLVIGFIIKPATPEFPVLTALHTTMTGSVANPGRSQLLNGAQIDIRGEAAVDQSLPGSAQLQLHAGMVHASVPKLPQGQSFVVMTPHAEVTVHGTRFTVEQSPAGETSVSVDEGLVAVRPLDGHRPTLFVRPGESVTVKPFSAYFAELDAEVSRRARTRECNDPQDLVAKYIEAAPPSADVSLAHTLLGLCARGRGDTSTAIDQLELAAQTSPNRDRADNSLADAAQLRQSRDAADGHVAWERYLKRFPNGLHTDLAHKALDTN